MKKPSAAASMCLHTTPHMSLNYKVKPPWRIGIWKEARLSSPKHLMQQKQLVVAFSLWWQVIAERPEARAVKIYWEANSLTFSWNGNKVLLRCCLPALRQRKKTSAVRISAHRSSMASIWEIFTFQRYKAIGDGMWSTWEEVHNLGILWWEQQENVSAVHKCGVLDLPR